MPEPRPKAIMSTRSVGTPTAEAIGRFCVTPRTKRPSRVRLSTSATAPSTASAKPMITIRLYGSTSDPNWMPPDSQAGFSISTFCGPKIWRTAWIRIRLTPQVASSVSSGRP